jgi:arylsulfatase A-like enzyme
MMGTRCNEEALRKNVEMKSTSSPQMFLCQTRLSKTLSPKIIQPRRRAIRKAACLLVCLMSGLSLIQCESRALRPNILLILADDLGYNDLGLSNDKFVTPNLTALAASGVRFTRHYADAVCSTTRAGLLTGVDPAHLGFRPLRQGISSDVETLPKVLSRAGYSTYHIGKWHVGNATAKLSPMEAGFDDWYGYLTQWDLGGKKKWPTYLDPWLQSSGTKPSQVAGHLTDLVTNKTIEVIDELSAVGEPWFINLWYYAPHGPLDPAPRFAEKYPDTGEGKYYATVEQLDQSIGRVVEHLRKQGIADDTLIVFLSDNGGTNTYLDNNYPYVGRKGQFLEGGVRTPMIWHWPGQLDEGRRVEEVVSYLDLLPTLAAVSGAPSTEHTIAGKDLWPAVERDGPFPVRTLFWESITGDSNAYSVLDRDGVFRLVSRDGVKRLFDVEDRNAANRDVSEDHPDVMSRLQNEYEAWHASGHEVPVDVTRVNESGAALVEGHAVQRTPGYAGFSFAIGVTPVVRDNGGIRSAVVVDDLPYWRLALTTRGTLQLDMLGERLNGPALIAEKCSAIVVTSYFARSRRYPQNETGQIDLYVDGLRVATSTAARPLRVPAQFDRRTRVGFDRQSAEPGGFEFTSPRFFNDYFSPSRIGKPKADDIELLSREVCSLAAAG